MLAECEQTSQPISFWHDGTFRGSRPAPAASAPGDRRPPTHPPTDPPADAAPNAQHAPPSASPPPMCTAPVSLFHVDEQTGEPSGALNFVCEIPRFTRKKFEVATDEPRNPIKQDTKKGVLREFKKGDIGFNYGCFPRTWEDPNFVHPDAGAGGDNDPLDVCEIGLRIGSVGEVTQVKVLGCLCMIDDGEADWKVIAIDVRDRWASELNDVSDVERLLPGTISAVREWFRTYKIPDGKPPNVFGLGERCMPKDYAMQIVGETHHAWRRLVRERFSEKLANGVPQAGGDFQDEADEEAAERFCPKLAPESEGGAGAGAGAGAPPAAPPAAEEEEEGICF